MHRQHPDQDERIERESRMAAALALLQIVEPAPSVTPAQVGTVTALPAPHEDERPHAAVA